MATLSKGAPVGTYINDQIIDPKPKLTTIDLVGGIYCHICHLTIGSKKEFDSHYMQHGSGNADITYTCVVCLKEIVGYPSFRGHCYLVHVMKDKFKCEHCFKMFSKQSALQSHIKNMHELINKCLICQKKFQSRKELLLHNLIHKNTENSPPYECQICGDRLDTPDDCDNHIENHCFMFYSCPICNEDISDIQHAASHLTKHFGNVLNNTKPGEDTTDMVEERSNDSSIDLIGGILCSYCDSTYKDRPDFDNHILTEHPFKEIIYACNICGKEYEKYFNFANHCYDHTTKDRFQCEECSKTFPRLSLLVIHVEAYHSGTKPLGEDAHPFTCLQCNHGFMTDRRLKEHYRSMHKIYYSQCPEQGCGKTFDAPRDLILHLREHNSVQNWCKQCGLRFYSLQACEKHLQYHKKKLYSCPICSRSYGEKYLVIKHLHQHFSAVLHVCKVCGKIYNGRNRLVEHMKVHNEVKPHNCTFCGKGFTKIYLLQQHLNVHTGQKPYKCTDCPKTFASYPNLRKHLRNLHNHSSKRILNENNNHNDFNKAVDYKIVDDSMSDSGSDMAKQHSNSITENTKVAAPVVDTSVNVSNTVPSFEESNTSMGQWISSSIDPIVLGMLEENIVSPQGTDVEVNNIDFQKELWVPSSNFQPGMDSCEALVPREYGPEFVFGAEAASVGAGFIPLGDPPLPHIDPRLTVLHPVSPTIITSSPCPSFSPNPAPVLTKLESPFDFDAARFAVNANIF